MRVSFGLHITYILTCGKLATVDDTGAMLQHMIRTQFAPSLWVWSMTALLLTSHSANLAAETFAWSQVGRKVEELRRGGQFDKALVVLRAEVARLTAKHGPGHPEVGRWRNEIAAIWAALGQTEKAAELYRRVADETEMTNPLARRVVSASLRKLLIIMMVRGRHQQASKISARLAALPSIAQLNGTDIASGPAIARVTPAPANRQPSPATRAAAPAAKKPGVSPVAKSAAQPTAQPAKAAPAREEDGKDYAEAAALPELVVTPPPAKTQPVTPPSAKAPDRKVSNATPSPRPPAQPAAPPQTEPRVPSPYMGATAAIPVLRKQSATRAIAANTAVPQQGRDTNTNAGSKATGEVIVPPKPRMASLAKPLPPAIGAEPGPPTCGAPSIELSVDALGLAQVAIVSGCRKDETVKVSYADISRSVRLDANGRAKFTVDLYAGEGLEPAVSFKDGFTTSLQIPKGALAGVTKIAIAWDGDIDLDLHAFEHASRFGSEGHIWAGRALTAEAVMTRIAQSHRSHGLLTTTFADKDTSRHIEVYTLVHGENVRTGAIKLAVDYKTRGDVPAKPYCGTHRYASVMVDVYRSDRGGKLVREIVELAAAPCGKPLTRKARYIGSVIPDLLLGK